VDHTGSEGISGCGLGKQVIAASQRISHLVGLPA
jgi:hypothetical protein